MEPPENDESISLLGEALKNLMASEDGQSGEPIPAGDTMEFHRYMNLPYHVREMIREEVTDHHYYFAHFASVSKEWQGHVEGYTFRMIRIDPSIEEDVLKFKQLFKNQRRGYLKVLDIIIDDRKTGPWRTNNSIVQISQVMEKIRIFFHYINSWDRNQVGDLEINFVSLDLEFGKFDVYGHSVEDSDEDSDEDYSEYCDPYSDKAFNLGPSIRTTSLWTKCQLHLLGNSNLASDKPLWANWSECPKDFGIVKQLKFPLDCVPLPVTMAIVGTMQNLVSCSFELDFARVAHDVDERAAEEGMAGLADFFQKLPTLTPSLSELSIRIPHKGPPLFEGESAHRLTAALRDSSQRLKTLKVEGILLQQNFFESFGEGCDPVLAASELRWPNLEELNLGVVTYGPEPGPFSKPNQSSLTPTGLVIAAGRANIAMPRLRNFELYLWDESPDKLNLDFSITRGPLQDLESFRECRVRLNDFTKDQDQRILCAWSRFLRAQARLVSTVTGVKSESRVYKTFAEDYSPRAILGAAALVNNSDFLEAQRLARINLGLPTVFNP